MPYSLGQNPVPVWAAPEHKVPIKVKPDDLPAYMFSKDPHQKSQEQPHFLRQNGRWNSMKTFKDSEGSVDVASTSQEVDPTLLDVYDLETKWENRMDNMQEKNSNMLSLQNIQDKLIWNLGANPYFPIVFRGSAAVFSVITLGLSCDVFHVTKNYENSYGLLDFMPGGVASSTIYTIVISCLSIVYSGFMLWDETFGQPLGLRPSHTKIKYVFLDLMLLCLQAGNSAAAFDMLIDRQWVCPKEQHIRICSIHKAVIAFIIITSIVHSLSFLVSVFRMIHRASH